MRFFQVGLAIGVAGLAAADWPQFRGPGGSGVAESAVPVSWDKSKNVIWAKEIPGLGWASPVVSGGRVFLLTADGEGQTKPSNSFGTAYPDAKNLAAPIETPPGTPAGFSTGKQPDILLNWQVLCLDAGTGRELWTTTLAAKKPPFPTFASNGYASETPVAEGDKLYAYAAAVGLFCLDGNGKIVWQTQLGSYPTAVGFGTGSSPVIHGNRVYVLYDNEVQSFLAAIDKATGKEVWRVDRPGKSSWASPFVWQTKERTELVCCGDKLVISYDPDSGRELWRLGGIDSGFSATPAANEDMIFFGTSGPGSNAPLYAVRAGAAGDITLQQGRTNNDWVVWSRMKSGPGTASMVLYDNYLYVAGSRGTLSCFNAKTGEPAYKDERLPKNRYPTASLWAAAGKVYVLDDFGRAAVVAAGPQFEVLADNPLDEMCWATPAVADGRLYIRGRDKLYCVAERK